MLTQRRIQRGARGMGAPPSFLFAITSFFCNHFEELQTVLIKVKLIINNEPSTYVYPNTIKTYLTLNYLLFSRQLLCYSNTISTVVRNLTVLSSTTDKTSCISNHFWHRWKHKYVVNLCETTSIKIKYKLSKNYVVLVYDKNGAQTHLDNCHSNRDITQQSF